MDKKALDILLNAYWGAGGWKDGKVTDEDFLYAKSQGAMFSPLSISHNEAVRRLKATTGKISKQEAANSFLASLSSRELEYRSVLDSYVFASSLPTHNYENISYSCKVCGLHKRETETHDLNVLNFERYKWGGVRHTDIIYALFDLEQFMNMEKVKPTEQDYFIFRNIINTIENLDESAKARDIEKAISGIIKSNKSEREMLINTLGYCSILETSEHIGFFSGYTDKFLREPPPANKIDWAYPVSWWKKSFGINKEALYYYFPFMK